MFKPNACCLLSRKFGAFLKNCNFCFDSLPGQYSVSFISFIVRVIVRGRPSRIATIMIVTAKAIRHDQVSCTSSSKL